MFDMYIDGSYISFSEIRDLKVEILEERKYGVTFEYTDSDGQPQSGVIGAFDKYSDAYEVMGSIARLIELERK